MREKAVSKRMHPCEGMGHWFDCLGYGSGHDEGSSAPLSELCLQEAVQAGPGAYGYFPLLDRQRGFYMQIVLAEDVLGDTSECLSMKRAATLAGSQVPQRNPGVPPHHCKACRGCSGAARADFKRATAAERLSL